LKPLDPLTLPLSGTVVVEASAGTGKTFTLSNLYLRLIVEAGREVDGILVVTYTNAATAELRDRIRRRLRAALVALRGGPAEDDFLAAFAASRRARGAIETDLRRLEGALRGFDEAAIFTIHGFCQRMLHENAFESVCRFDAELVADQRPLCREIVEDHLVKVLHDAPHALVAHLQRRSGWLDELERLVAIVVSHPDVPVLPERPRGLPREELERAIAARREALREAARLWRRSRDEIVALLTTSPSLNRNTYRPNAIPTWAVAMDELLAEVDLDLQLFEQFAKFTPRAIRAAAKQRTVPPVHPFFDACEVVLAADAKSTDVEQSAPASTRCSPSGAPRSAATTRRTRSPSIISRTFRDALAGRSGPPRRAHPRALPPRSRDVVPDTDRFSTRSSARSGDARAALLIGDRSRRSTRSAAPTFSPTSGRAATRATCPTPCLRITARTPASSRRRTPSSLARATPSS
jgi:ATP-dependent exoDNAse (exonuclease V) beta subunit